MRKSVILIVFLATLLAGCAPQILQSAPTQSYRVGQTIRATPGGVLLSVQHGNVQTVRRWVGILHSPDGWKTTKEHSSNYVRKELIYSGLSGSTIEIGYREFRGEFAAPAFYQTAKYDLNASRDISFQNFRIRIDSADNNSMVGVLLSDGSSIASGTPPQQAGPQAVQKGESKEQAEKSAIDAKCHSKPTATLVGKGPGFESYTVPCASGDTIMIRCEHGNCRTLR